MVVDRLLKVGEATEPKWAWSRTPSTDAELLELQFYLESNKKFVLNENMDLRSWKGDVSGQFSVKASKALIEKKLLLNDIVWDLLTNLSNKPIKKKSDFGKTCGLVRRLFPWLSLAYLPWKDLKMRRWLTDWSTWMGRFNLCSVGRGRFVAMDAGL
ncbi:hypothetical protein L1987_72192 [Smallanthus sonchifolius]|uniref:Uncharacterized protein n=1 Tax=Smallanthus sonchifolius TaxID=185202 RepID=A0ACB9ATM2_9ASTR|nr:hypothetical protein L1987_72192 [Smallanthus sonchifolius]